MLPNPFLLLTGIEKWAKYSTHQPKRAMGSMPHPCPSTTAQTEARLVRSKTRNGKAHTRPINPYSSNTENRIFPKRYPIHQIKSHYKRKKKNNRRPSVKDSPIKKEDYSKQIPLTNPLLNLRLTIKEKISSNENKSQSLSNQSDIYYKYRTTLTVRDTHFYSLTHMQRRFF